MIGAAIGWATGLAFGSYYLYLAHQSDTGSASREANLTRCCVWVAAALVCAAVSW